MQICPQNLGCISYFHAAFMKHHEQGTIQQKKRSLSLKVPELQSSPKWVETATNGRCDYRHRILAVHILNHKHKGKRKSWSQMRKGYKISMLTPSDRFLPGNRKIAPHLPQILSPTGPIGQNHEPLVEFLIEITMQPYSAIF